MSLVLKNSSELTCRCVQMLSGTHIPCPVSYLSFQARTFLAPLVTCPLKIKLAKQPRTKSHTPNGFYIFKIVLRLFIL